MTKTCDVLIVGSGPTGLMMACLLSRWGISCRIIDRSLQQAHESRALAIQARSLEIFQNLGLVDRFLSRGYKAPGARLFLNGEEKAHLPFIDLGFKDTPYNFVFMLSQAETEKILLEDFRSRSGEVEHQTQLLGFEQGPTGVLARLQKPDGSTEIASAKYLVGCDGTHSKVREELGLTFKGGSYQDDFVLGDVQIDWNLPKTELMIFLSDEALGVLFPLKGEEISRVIAVQRKTSGLSEPKTSSTTSFSTTLEQVENAFAKAAQIPLKFHDPKWLARFRLHHRGVDQYQKDRVFVAGDAAHIHSPFGAQGMNTGLQDATNLAWKLALVLQGAASENLLKTYHEERWPIGQRLLNFTDRFFSIVSSRNHGLVLVRNFLLPFFAKFMMSGTAARKFAFHFISQLGIRYHLGLAVKEELTPQASSVFKKTLPTGRRAPNATIKPGAEIFDLLVNYQFHLLIFSRKSLDAKFRARIEAEIKKSRFPMTPHWLTSDEVQNVEIFERYGISDQGIFLVRPDGYVGFRSDQIDLNFLQTYRL